MVISLYFRVFFVFPEITLDIWRLVLHTNAEFFVFFVFPEITLNIWGLVLHTNGDFFVFLYISAFSEITLDIWGLVLHTNGDFFVFLVLGEWRGGGLKDCKKWTSFALVVLDDGLCWFGPEIWFGWYTGFKGRRFYYFWR